LYFGDGDRKMNDEDKNQNDHQNEEQESADENQPEYSEISKEKLKKILEDHKKWVESDGKEGVRIELRNANMQGAELLEANLQEAILFRANLKKANLIGANLKGAELLEANLQEAILYQANLKQAFLYDANLQEAKLTGANLQEAYLLNANLKNATLNGIVGITNAKLQFANLEGAIGLLGNEFAQADVKGTKLPNYIKEFKALDIVEKTSENARKIFFAMLLGCVYSWLTIATTTDVRLLTNTASSPLPIIGTEIPIAWFYIAAPLVLICIYFYFHLYLIKLWEALSGLPAIFPDGKRLDERAYPWLLNGLVRRYFEKLRTDRPLISHVQEWITIFLSWWVVPITMIAFWLRYIPRHDWWGTSFHIVLIVVSVAFSIIFHRICVLIFEIKKKDKLSIYKFWNDRRLYYGLGVVIVGFIFLLLSYGSINGQSPISINSKMLIYRYDKKSITEYEFEIVNLNLGDVHHFEYKFFVPWFFNKFGYNVFADMREDYVSERPINYLELLEKNKLKTIRGAKLRNCNLESSYMSKAFLVNSDLRYSNVKAALLMEADLQYINARKADFSYSWLVAANLKGADLKYANFYKTVIDGAILQDANLESVKNLTIGQLFKVNTLYRAKLDPELMERVKKSYPHLLEKPKEKNYKNERPFNQK
jgi:uncharacterized protein YjbI with pentapeptide repeats